MPKESQEEINAMFQYVFDKAAESGRNDVLEAKAIARDIIIARALREQLLKLSHVSIEEKLRIGKLINSEQFDEAQKEIDKHKAKQSNTLKRIPDVPKVPTKRLLKDIPNIPKVPTKRLLKDIPDIPRVPTKRLLKDIPDLVEVSEKRIKLSPKLTVSSNKTHAKVISDIDKLMKDVNAIIKKNGKAGLSIPRMRSEIFNTLLKEVDKQYEKGLITKGEAGLIVTKLTEGDLKTASNLLHTTDKVKEINKLIKSIPKPMTKPKPKATAKPKTTRKPKQPTHEEEYEEKDDDYFESLPKNKNGTYKKTSKEWKALSESDKARAIELSPKAILEKRALKKKPAPKRKTTTITKEEIEEIKAKNIHGPKTIEEAREMIKNSKIPTSETETLKELSIAFVNAVKRLPSPKDFEDMTPSERKAYGHQVREANEYLKDLEEMSQSFIDTGKLRFGQVKIIRSSPKHDTEDAEYNLDKIKRMI